METNGLPNGFVSSEAKIFLHVWRTCSDNCVNFLVIVEIKEVLRLQTLAPRAVAALGGASMRGRRASTRKYHALKV